MYILSIIIFDYCWMLNLHGQQIGTTAEACWKLSRALQSWKWMKSPPVAHNETFIAHAALQVLVHDFLSSTVWFTHLSMPHLPHPCSNAFHNLKAFISLHYTKSERENWRSCSSKRNSWTVFLPMRSTASCWSRASSFALAWIPEMAWFLSTFCK